MTKHFSGACKLAAIGLAVAAAVAMPLSASAHDGWGGHGHGHGHGDWEHGGDHHGGYHGGDYGRGGGHWSGGRWIAGAIVTGVVLGLVSDALNPRPVYYGAPVVYSQPDIVYQDGPPVVRRRVVETRTVVYDDPQQTRYIHDDGYDQDYGD